MRKTIQESVAEKISSCGETVFNTVVDKLSEIEISKRVEAITKAISKKDALEKELKKIEGKNDNIVYVDGEKKESMTEKRYNEIKKAKESLENFNKLLESALESNTQEAYNKLNGAIGGNKPEGSGESKSEA